MGCHHHRRHYHGHRGGGANERVMEARAWDGWRLPTDLYRDPERGRVAGVCAGLGAYFQIKPKFIRLAAIIGSVFGFFLPIALLYAVLAVLLPLPPADEEDAAGEGTLDAVSTTAELKERFIHLERRLSAIEEWVISDDYRLRQQFRDL